MNRGRIADDQTTGKGNYAVTWRVGLQQIVVQPDSGNAHLIIIKHNTGQCIPDTGAYIGISDTDDIEIVRQLISIGRQTAAQTDSGGIICADDRIPFGTGELFSKVRYAQIKTAFCPYDASASDPYSSQTKGPSPTQVE